MYPHERSLVKQLAGKPFALIGVNSDSDLDVLKETIKKKKLNWRSFRNDEGVDGTISEMWGIQGWPTIFIIDAEGVIRWSGHGPDFDPIIEELLAEMGHEVTIVHEPEESEESGEENAGDEADAESREGDSDGGHGKEDGNKIRGAESASSDDG